MSQAPTGIGPGPRRSQKAQPLRAAWCQWVENSIRTLGRRATPLQTPIIGGGNGAKGCIAWKPKFSTEDDESTVTFGLGLLNQIAATNWNEPLAIGAEEVKWAVLDVTASNGQITGFTISLDDDPPGEDQIAEDFPPDSFKVVLGVIDSLKATMAACENFEASAIEVFRQSRNPPVPGAEPFTRWWRWKVNQNTAGEYPFVT